MMKIKIFKSENEQDLEDDINTWLAMQVAGMDLMGINLASDYDSYIAMLVYVEPVFELGS